MGLAALIISGDAVLALVLIAVWASVSGSLMLLAAQAACQPRSVVASGRERRVADLGYDARRGTIDRRSGAGDLGHRLRHSLLACGWRLRGQRMT